MNMLDEINTALIGGIPTPGEVVVAAITNSIRLEVQLEAWRQEVSEAAWGTLSPEEQEYFERMALLERAP